MTVHKFDHLDTAADAPASTRPVVAPVDGSVLPLADVPDPAFSIGALGRGTAIRPSGGTIVAPIDGELVAAMPHAYGIRGGGLEVLVHFGIDTVELGGRHFTSAVAQGALVRAGDVLGTADVSAIAAAGFETAVIVVLTNSGELGDIVPTTAPDVTVGDVLLTVEI